MKNEPGLCRPCDESSVKPCSARSGTNSSGSRGWARGTRSPGRTRASVAPASASSASAVRAIHAAEARVCVAVAAELVPFVDEPLDDLGCLRATSPVQKKVAGTARAASRSSSRGIPCGDPAIGGQKRRAVVLEVDRDGKVTMMRNPFYHSSGGNLTLFDSVDASNRSLMGHSQSIGRRNCFITCQPTNVARLWKPSPSGLPAAFVKLRMITWGLLDTTHPILAQIVPMRRCNLACGYCNEYDKVSAPVPTRRRCCAASTSSPSWAPASSPSAAASRCCTPISTPSSAASATAA